MQAHDEPQLIDLVRNHFGQGTRWVLVVGDLMLDRYLIGSVQRISPEAPVPVVLLNNKQERAGGAANVAVNLASLGIATTLGGCVGNDAEADVLIDIINQAGISSAGILKSPHRPTVTKTRVLGGHQQMIRLDQESSEPFQAKEKEDLRSLVSQQIAAKPALIILSDYAKGVLDPALCSQIIAQAKQANIPVLVDPKGRDYSKYKGATGLTPNKREAAEACNINAADHAGLLSAANQLRQSLALEFLAITRGEEGITLIDENATLNISATAKQVFDVSGAGDTVIATLAAGLIHGLNHQQALKLANIAAGIVVGKVGTAPILKQELLNELVSQNSAVQTDKICNINRLKDLVALWRGQNQKIVFTNGCFDLLHAGHVTYLEAARKEGGRLILGLNTDRSVSALKGPTRPVIHEQDRARVLAALESVDAVILFDEDTPLNLIHAIHPEVIVKGSDYTEDQVVGGAEVKSWGGRVALIDIVPGRSTSKIINKLAS